MDITVQAYRQPDGSYTLNLNEYFLFLIEKALDDSNKHRERARINEAKKKGYIVSNRKIPALSIQRVDTTPVSFVGVTPSVIPSNIPSVPSVPTPIRLNILNH